MEPKTDAQEVLETPETVTETVETPEELTAEEISELRAKAAKADELEAKNKQLYARVKKDEAKPVHSEPKADNLSMKDAVYVAKADIHADDVDEVLDTARLRNWDVKKAHEYLKPILAARSEERKTASVANVSPARRGATKLSDDEVLDKARKGYTPESDDEIKRLVGARHKTRQ